MPNGMTLLVETMPNVRSASFCLAIPAGSVYEPSGEVSRSGTAMVLADLMFRGAGKLNGRQLLARIDELGLQNEESVTPGFMLFNGVCLKSKLSEVFRLYGDVIQRPLMPASHLQPAVEGLEQMLLGVEDDPKQKVIQELKRRAFPAPWGKPTDGELDDLPNIDIESVEAHYQQHIRPNGAILAVAGDVRWDDVLADVQAAFGDWKPRLAPEVVVGACGERLVHMPVQSTQTQIGIAYPAVPYPSDDYYAAWAAVSVLSGGMSSRLFTEVREKRGLCYTVYASLAAIHRYGQVICYAGSTVDRAQETLNVIVAELHRLGDGIELGELRRCQALAKTSLIMSQESTLARAGAMVRDWHHLGRIVPLEEVRQRIESLTPEVVVDYVRRYPANELTILTMGQQPLEVPV